MSKNLTGIEAGRQGEQSTLEKASLAHLAESVPSNGVVVPGPFPSMLSG